MFPSTKINPYCAAHTSSINIRRFYLAGRTDCKVRLVQVSFSIASKYLHGSKTLKLRSEEDEIIET